MVVKSCNVAEVDVTSETASGVRQNGSMGYTTSASVDVGPGVWTLV